ncbi:MAG: uncharacterized protein QOE14_728, partial [Humisphaera sp.]|nr:uncharacterized protein [Humisphaera sp.]
MKATDEPLARVGIAADTLAAFAKRHGLRELAIFGSVLREDFGPDSDVDVLFELQPQDELTIEKFLS